MRPLGSEKKIMKYMTPELLARFRSLDDETAEAASVEWERQCEAYENHLKEIRPYLSRGVRRFLQGSSFHDAKVLAMTADDAAHFSLFLEPNEPGEKKNRIELRYRLAIGSAKGYEIFRHPVLSGDGNPFGWWLYDEFDIVKGDVSAMTHSILFTGGCELRLTFFALSCRRLNFVSIPVEKNGAVDLEDVFMGITKGITN
jgi:hypothetical protein